MSGPTVFCFSEQILFQLCIDFSLSSSFFWKSLVFHFFPLFSWDFLLSKEALYSFQMISKMVDRSNVAQKHTHLPVYIAGNWILKIPLVIFQY